MFFVVFEELGFIFLRLIFNLVLLVFLIDVKFVLEGVFVGCVCGEFFWVILGFFLEGFLMLLVVIFLGLIVGDKSFEDVRFEIFDSLGFVIIEVFVIFVGCFELVFFVGLLEFEIVVFCFDVLDLGVFKDLEVCGIIFV